MCTHVSGVRMSVSLQSGFCDNTVYMYYQRRVRVLFVQRVGRACSVTVLGRSAATAVYWSERREGHR
eukprot:6016386-Prymnesium_polylepis.1